MAPASRTLRSKVTNVFFSYEESTLTLRTVSIFNNHGSLQVSGAADSQRSLQVSGAADSQRSLQVSGTADSQRSLQVSGTADSQRRFKL